MDRQVILIAHGKMALAMKDSAEMIFGELPLFDAVEFLAADGLDVLKGKLNKAIKPETKEVLVFADLFGGTPFNAACALKMEDEQRNFEVLSGMSLPLVLEVAASISSMELKEITDSIKNAAPFTVQSFEVNNTEDEEDF